MLANRIWLPILSTSKTMHIQYQLIPSICMPGAFTYQGSTRRNPSPPLDAAQADIAIAGFHHTSGEVLALGVVEQNRFPLLGFVRKLRERVQGSAGVCRGGPASTPATRAIASGQAPQGNAYPGELDVGSSHAERCPSGWQGSYCLSRMVRLPPPAGRVGFLRGVPPASPSRASQWPNS